MTETSARKPAVFGAAWSFLFAAAHYYWAPEAGPCKDPESPDRGSQTHRTALTDEVERLL